MALERPGESLVGAVAGGERQIGHRVRRRPERDGGGLEASPADVLRHPFTDRRPEDPVKMVRRQMGDIGEALEGQLTVQMLLDVELHPQNSQPVRFES